MELPAPGADALAHSARLQALIRDEIHAAGGSLPFSRYMALALYAPGLGYYMAGSRKLGADGDFVTAPELSPLFGQALAQQAAEVLAMPGCDAVLEIGAGSGALAAALLEELERLGRLPAQYLILELSPDLRARSRDTLAARVPHLIGRVAWLNQLPPRFSGFIIGNEVLDAMPCALVFARDGEILETHVRATAAGGFETVDCAPEPAVLAAAAALALPPQGYRSELQLEAQAFLRTLGGVLERGVALFLDYGFPQREYYHPQRNEGTLMCHYRHRAHADPFLHVGLQDITTHVDFTAMATAARAGGLQLAGYASQAQFLINCGITDVLARTDAADVRAYAPLAAGVQKLLAPSEMGELFKAVAFTRGWDAPLAGFAQGDRSRTL
ncbi:MAG: class I SAM-dependent methyltransferase [Burkholderiales bacterium]